jgi:hypothetical protein
MKRCLSQSTSTTQRAMTATPYDDQGGVATNIINFRTIDPDNPGGKLSVPAQRDRGGVAVLLPISHV